VLILGPKRENTPKSGLFKNEGIPEMVVNKFSSDAWCRAYIKAVWKSGVNDPLVPPDSYYQLSAADLGDPDFAQGFILPKNSPRYFKLVEIPHDSKLMIVASKEYTDNREINMTAGTYRLDVAVSGKKCRTATKEVTIGYAGDGTAPVIK
jgi:hypothetical protein